MAGTSTSGRKPKITNVDAKNKPRAERAQRAIDNNATLQPLGDVPNRLSDEEKALYAYIVSSYAGKGVIKDLDSSLLEEFVAQVIISRKARAVINEKGITYYEDDKFKKNPAVDVLNNAVKNIKSLGSSLGMDPISRSAMLSETPVDDGESVDDTVSKFGG